MLTHDSFDQDYDLKDLILDMVQDDSDKELLKLLLQENDDQKVFATLLEGMKQVKND